jgi:hypothetical protein
MAASGILYCRQLKRNALGTQEITQSSDLSIVPSEAEGGSRIIYPQTTSSHWLKAGNEGDSNSPALPATWGQSGLQ